MIFRSRKNSQAAVADREPPVAAGKDTDELFAEIEELSLANRENPDPGVESRLVELRHAAGIRLLDGPGSDAAFPIRLSSSSRAATGSSRASNPGN